MARRIDARITGRITALIGIAAVTAAMLLAPGCGNPVRKSTAEVQTGLPSGSATGTVKVPSTLSLSRGVCPDGICVSRTAALSSEKSLPGANVTLWRIQADGTYSQVSGVATTTDTTSAASGTFVITGIPLSEANLIIQASYTPAGTGVPVVLRTSLPTLDSSNPVQGQVTVNTESTMAVEGLRLAVKLTNENSASTTSKEAKYFTRSKVEALHTAVNSYLVTELRLQGTTVNVDNVLTNSNSLTKEFIDLKKEQYYVDSAFDGIKPATSTVSISGKTATSTVSVTLSKDETSGSIYFTTDGTTPTTDSQAYSSTISMTATTTLKFFAYDADGNSENVHTEQYYIHTNR